MNYHVLEVPSQKVCHLTNSFWILNIDNLNEWYNQQSWISVKNESAEFNKLYHKFSFFSILRLALYQDWHLWALALFWDLVPYCCHNWSLKKLLKPNLKKDHGLVRAQCRNLEILLSSQNWARVSTISCLGI